MRKLLLTSVGITALTLSANATDFTLSGTAKIRIADDGNTSNHTTTQIGVSKTFDNGMTATYTAGLSDNAANNAEMSVSSDAITVTFGDIDQNEKAPGLNGDAAASDIGTEGVGNAADNGGAISLGATIAGAAVGASTNNAGDTLFGASINTDMGGMAVTVGGDVYNDSDNASADQTSLGVKATLGSLVVVMNSTQNEASSGDLDDTSYSAAYTMGGLVIGFQGNDNDKSSYSATYTIVPGMQFELGSTDNGTTSTSSGELQLSF